MSTPHGLAFAPVKIGVLIDMDMGPKADFLALMGRMFRRLGWNPPRIMTTAFQFCYAKPEWMAALEGWHGIDQLCEDDPRLASMLRRFTAKTGSTRDHTVIALSYDTARLIAEGIARATLVEWSSARRSRRRWRGPLIDPAVPVLKHGIHRVIRS